MAAAHASLVIVVLWSRPSCLPVTLPDNPTAYDTSGAFSPWIQDAWLQTGVERMLTSQQCRGDAAIGGRRERDLSRHMAAKSTPAAPQKCAWRKELVLSASPDCSHARHTQPMNNAAHTSPVRHLRSVPVGFDSHRLLPSPPSLGNNSQGSPRPQARWDARRCGLGLAGASLAIATQACYRARCVNGEGGASQCCRP